MSIFNPVLFAGDFSEASRSAFAAARSLARGSGARLHVLNVDEPALVAEPSGLGRNARLPAILPPQTQAHLDEVETQLREFYGSGPDVAVDYHVRAGHAAEEILRAADELGAAIVVLGTEGRGGVHRLACGSVAEAVLRRLHRPVMVVHGPAPTTTAPGIHRILIPTDFSEGSRPALAMAEALARAERAELILMHVAPERIPTGGTFLVPPILEPEREELARLEQREIAALSGITVRTHFCQGDPAAEILLMADDLRCDLIVMGSHGRTGLRRLLMGSVAESVCRRAPCPILIVRDAPGEPVAAAPEAEGVGVAASHG